jgi:ABC-2 type transport system permease protein
LAPSAWQIGAFLILCAAGILVHYSLMFLLASVAFWAVRAQGIVWGYYNLFNIARMPDAAFQGFFKAFFRFAIPMLLVANVPVKLLTDQLDSPWEMLLLAGMSVVCFAASEIFWRFSVKHYTSASA